MVTRKLGKSDKEFLKTLGRKIESIIIEDKGYKSLDAFSLEHYDLIAKPTLYQICQGKRDMKLTTLRNLCAALDIKISDLLNL